VFGHSEAPFETVTEAANWVEKESNVDLRDWREGNEERDEARREIERLAREHHIEFDEKRTSLTYQRPGDEHVKHARAIPNTRLYRLAKETKRIAEHTGLPEDAFTMHVLTDLKPMLSRVRIKTTKSILSVPNREQVISRWIEAKIFSKDLNDRELKTLYSSIRESIGSKGDKRLTTEEQDFWELMEKMGAPPEKDKGKFWEEALRRWKEPYPDTNINSRDGVKRKYERLSQRLDSP
jgi:hypothetical protein